MDKKIFIFLNVFLIAHCAEEYWLDPWISNTGSAVYVPGDGALGGLLRIPEFNITQINDVVATLNYNPGRILTVVCQGQACEGLVNYTNIENNELRVVETELDFDTNSQPNTVTLGFMLDVTAWTKCAESFEIKCKELQVDLENINDKYPVWYGFDPNTVIQLLEGQDDDTVLTIAGRDEEFDGQDEDLTLSLKDTDPFSITRIEGELASWNLAVKDLDFDIGPKMYTLDLVLTDKEDRFGRTNPLSASLVINVKDQPDNEPDWYYPCTYITKDEGLAVDTEYYRIKAVDRDSDINSQMTYTILNSTYDYFDLKAGTDDFWIVYNKREIDRESMNNDFIISLFIEAEETEACVPVETCSTKKAIECIIGINDQNDNDPTFNAERYEADVKENIALGEPFTFKNVDGDGETPLIEDIDKDYKYSQFSIKFADPSDNEFLSLSPQGIMVSQGGVNIMSKLVDNKHLDFESRSEFEFSVVATDSENDHTSTAIFKVNIIDVNDCDPEFEQTADITFKEDLSDLTNNIITTVVAIDGDISECFGNSSIRYTLLDTPDGVSIDDTTGEITVDPENNPFDYEINSEYTIEIEARDCGTVDCACDQPSRFDKITLRITIKNVNDNPPKTDQEACNKTIFNTRNDPIILTLEATDPDGYNVAFSIDDSTENEVFFPFSITANGILKIDTSAIQEQEGPFPFTVMIKDEPPNDEEPLTTTIECTINIEDVNDKTPSFTFPENNKKYWIDEASEVDQPLYLYSGGQIKLEATDDDVNECYRSVSYKFQTNIQNTEYEEYFDLSDMGVITLKKDLSLLDLEEDGGISNLITLPVEAADASLIPPCEVPGDRINTNRADLQLKVFTNFPPEFLEKDQRPDFDETKPGAPHPSFNLAKAIDNNNEDPPDDPDWKNQQICYYLISDDEDIKEKFSIDKDENILNVIGDLDADCLACSSYEIEVWASNDCTTEPVNVGPESIQTVTVTINDLNDNVPEFVDILSYYVLSTTEDDADCKDCFIKANDADRFLDQTLHFTILSQKAHPAVNISSPFKLETSVDKAITIKKSDSYIPDDSMQIYFDLVLEVKDNDDPPHATNSSVKIVVMTAMNNVTFGFDNTLVQVETQEEEIFKVLNDSFKWSFSPKGTKGSSFTKNVDMFSETDPFTTLEGYFVDPMTFKPRSQSEIAVEYDTIFDDLWIALYRKANVTMDGTHGFRGATTDDFFNPERFSAMVVGSVAGGLLVVTALFLLTAYCVRTNALERRVKALDTDAIEVAPGKKQDKIFLAGLQENVPGSNEFAESGANPIWQAAMESNDYDEDEFQFDDDVSESSGDSILIGVEDQTEFNDYAEKMKEVEVDMDLYSRVQGRYKTLDDYQVPDEDTRDREDDQGRNPMYRGDSDDDSV